MSKKIDEALGKRITEAYLANPKQSVKKIWEKLGKPRGISYEKVLQFANNIMHQALQYKHLRDRIWNAQVPTKIYVDNGKVDKATWEREYIGHFFPERKE